MPPASCYETPQSRILRRVHAMACEPSPQSWHAVEPSLIHIDGVRERKRVSSPLRGLFASRSEPKKVASRPEIGVPYGGLWALD
jgi:hypothetical protein